MKELNRSIPLLFGVSTARASFYAIGLSLLSLVLTLVGYLLSEIMVDFPFFAYMSILIGLHGTIALMVSAGNLLFLFRYFLVWLLFFATSLVWALYGGEVAVAPFGVQYQTPATTRLLVLAGFISMCGSLIGWSLATVRVRRFPALPFVLSNHHRRRLKQIGAALAVVFALLFLYRVGGTIREGIVYSENVRDFGFEFGVFNVFHFIGIGMLILAGITDFKIRYSYLWFIIATLVIGVMAGSRADFLPQIFIFLILLFNRPIADMLLKRRYIRLSGCLALGALFVLFGYSVAIYIAFWRSGMGVGFILDRMFDSQKGGGLLINELFGHRMLYLETGNMMLGGMYVAIVNAANDGFLLGQSYFNYLQAAPPAFLGLPRPTGLEEATYIEGMLMSQGGILEVAEAYWNFGLPGCLFVSFMISYLFGWLLRVGLAASNYFFLIWYIVFGFLSFRGIWYQNFTYFRIMTVMLVLYAVGMFLFRWFVSNRVRLKAYS